MTMLSIRSTGPLPFTVTRHEPELIVPAKATPGGLKPLSDIDDQVRFFIPVMLFYPRRCGGDVPITGDVPKDPVRVIREALAEALVYYYPLAGRLREGPRGKLSVDCTGEGVVFVEADAAFTLEDLRRECGGFLRPPFPCELSCDVPAGSSGILNSPLFLFQVTRFRCGGFSFALQINHTMCDATGLLQFINAVAEFASGETRPSVLPVWSRELILVRDLPRMSCTHQEYRQVDGPAFPLQYNEDIIIERSFFFGPVEIAAIRRRLQRRCSTFELLSAFLWRCRIIALRFDPREEVRYLCLVSVRSKLKSSLLVGYYGNTFVFSAAMSTAGELSENRLDYAVELIKKAKEEVTEEYMQSVMDLMTTSSKPYIMGPGTWGVSDNTCFEYLEIDFGWGKPEYGGPTSAMIGAMPGRIGYFVKGVNDVGESGVFLLSCLPATAMERFATEVRSAIATSRL